MRFIATTYYESGSPAITKLEYVALVLCGNESGPGPALVEVGFILDEELVELDPQHIPGIAHMTNPGEDHVYARRYRFDRDALDGTIRRVHELIQRGRIEARGITLRVEVDEQLVNRHALEAHVELLRDRPTK